MLFKYAQRNLHPRIKLSDDSPNATRTPSFYSAVLHLTPSPLSTLTHRLQLLSSATLAILRLIHIHSSYITDCLVAYSDYRVRMGNAEETQNHDGKCDIKMSSCYSSF